MGEDVNDVRVVIDGESFGAQFDAMRNWEGMDLVEPITISIPAPEGCGFDPTFTMPCACETGKVYRRAVWVSDDPSAEPSVVDCGWQEAPCPMCEGTAVVGPPPWREDVPDGAWRVSARGTDEYPTVLPALIPSPLRTHPVSHADASERLGLLLAGARLVNRPAIPSSKEQT